MFNQNTSADTRIAVLEERLSSYEIMLRKIDEAIQIMGKTSLNISKMLAVHEEKIDQCGRTDTLITEIIHDVRTENKARHEEIEERILSIETEVKEISRIKWMTVGCGVLLTILVASFASLASGWWTPSEMQMQRQGHAHQQNVAD